MTDKDDWINDLGREWTGRQQKADGEKRRLVDEERPRREAREHFWSEFRAAVEQIVRDFNTAVGQSLVELSPGQKNVSSLGVKAGSTHLRATIDSDSKLRIEQPGRLAWQPSECSASCMSTAGSSSPTCLPAQAASPASSSSHGSSRLCEDGSFSSTETVTGCSRSRRPHATCAGRCVGRGVCLVTGRQPRILPRETPQRVRRRECWTRRPAPAEFDLQRIAGAT